MRDRSLDVYRRAAEHAAARGIILADTKFEWGRLPDGAVDPDRRSADAGQLALLAGGSVSAWAISPPSFDKQFVRDWLETSGWDKNSPPPELPPDVVERTAAKYREAFDRLTA